MIFCLIEVCCNAYIETCLNFIRCKLIVSFLFLICSKLDHSIFHVSAFSLFPWLHCMPFLVLNMDQKRRAGKCIKRSLKLWRIMSPEDSSERWGSETFSFEPNIHFHACSEACHCLWPGDLKEAKFHNVELVQYGVCGVHLGVIWHMLTHSPAALSTAVHFMQLPAKWKLTAAM